MTDAQCVLILRFRVAQEFGTVGNGWGPGVDTSENNIERGADDFWGERFTCDFGNESTTSETVPLGALVRVASVNSVSLS